ncbi:hypothetical protein Bbelb_221480 [Branchiostoma belcheri]|nr:hypothetical protein Bbelb_221480 [Branchiostoma belcheri]
MEHVFHCGLPEVTLQHSVNSGDVASVLDLGAKVTSTLGVQCRRLQHWKTPNRQTKPHYYYGTAFTCDFMNPSAISRIRRASCSAPPAAMSVAGVQRPVFLTGAAGIDRSPTGRLPPESAERKGPSENFVPLPKSEIRLCAGITVCLVVYVLYCVYRFSEGTTQVLVDLKNSCL